MGKRELFIPKNLVWRTYHKNTEKPIFTKKEVTTVYIS